MDDHQSIKEMNKKIPEKKVCHKSMFLSQFWSHARKQVNVLMV